MHPQLAILQAVSDQDETLAELRREAEKATARLESARRSLTELNEAIEARNAEITENGSQSRGLQRELEEYEKRKRIALRSLETGAGDPDAAERQLARCTELIDDAETRALELLESRDDLTAAREALQAEARSAEATLKELEDQTPGVLERIAGESAEHTRIRDEQFATLEAEHAGRYHDLLPKRFPPVARIDRGSCVRCRMLVPSGMQMELKRGYMAVCPGCGRWLTYG